MGSNEKVSCRNAAYFFYEVNQTTKQSIDIIYNI